MRLVAFRKRLILYQLERSRLFMDISSLSTSMSLTNLQMNVGYSMLAKSMEVAEDTGDAITKIMEQSVNPNIGSNIDISV